MISNTFSISKVIGKKKISPNIGMMVISKMALFTQNMEKQWKVSVIYFTMGSR